MTSIVGFLMLSLVPGLVFGVLRFPQPKRLRNDPALCDAASVGDGRKLKQLLAGGVDPNSADEDGTTALMAAAFAGQAEVARELLEAGADPNIQDVSGLTALMNCAMANGELELGETHPIFREIVRMLLDFGADTELADQDGWTALDHAEGYDSRDFAELLGE